MIDLDALAHAASYLDPLPTSVHRIAGLVSAESPDIREVVDVVQYDQALAAMVLRVANSSWSGPRREITTVHDGVIRLGTAAVLSLALGTHVRGRLGGAVPEYGLAEGELWRHSVAAAQAAELLVRASPVTIGPEAPAAALLHDVGKLLMVRFLSDDLLAALGTAQAACGLTRLEAEMELLGVNHAELGGLIAQCWGLPDGIVRGIGYHHSPAEGRDPLCAVVHLADEAAKRVGAGIDEHAGTDAFAGALADLRLRAVDFDLVVERTAARLAEILALY